jgi:hypothetical protein
MGEGDKMVAISAILGTGPPPILDDLARDLLTDDERAELTWGDEALAPGADVSVTANEGPQARP